jgi:hypothetical protein
MAIYLSLFHFTKLLRFFSTNLKKATLCEGFDV